MRSEARTRIVAGVLALLFAALVAATYDGAAWPEGLGGSQSSEARDREPGEGRDGEGTQAEDLVPPEAEDPRTLPSWLRPLVLGALLVLALGAVIAVLLSVRVRLLRRRLKGDMPLRPDARAPEGQEVEPDDEAVETALADSLAGIGEGTPRNAVVACWIRLEELAVARGLERNKADTPAEFVARALEAYRLDAGTLDRLADLYREARFSQHALTEVHRSEARACLERLAEGVRTVRS